VVFSLSCRAIHPALKRKAEFAEITAGEICIKIFCEISHNPETNTQTNCDNITQKGGFAAFLAIVFFAHFFVIRSLIDIHTPIFT
jgi:hypothetical protein